MPRGRRLSLSRRTDACSTNAVNRLLAWPSFLIEPVGTLPNPVWRSTNEWLAAHGSVTEPLEQ